MVLLRYEKTNQGQRTAKQVAIDCHQAVSVTDSPPRAETNGRVLKEDMLPIDLPATHVCLFP